MTIEERSELMRDLEALYARVEEAQRKNVSDITIPALIALIDAFQALRGRIDNGTICIRETLTPLEKAQYDALAARCYGEACK